MRPGKDREPDGIDVLLQRGVGDHLGGLPQAGVDDFHPGVAQGAGDDLRSSIMAIQAGLGNQDAQLLGHRGGIRARGDYTTGPARRQRAASAPIIDRPIQLTFDGVAQPSRCGSSVSAMRLLGWKPCRRATGWPPTKTMRVGRLMTWKRMVDSTFR